MKQRLNVITECESAVGPFRCSACAAGARRTKRSKDARRPNSSAIWPTEDAAPRSVRRRQTCAGGFETALTFWGGYSAVFIDPDGHPWEVAHNPHWTVTADGGVKLASAG
jgi:hypothetical protein